MKYYVVLVHCALHKGGKTILGIRQGIIGLLDGPNFDFLVERMVEIITFFNLRTIISSRPRLES